MQFMKSPASKKIAAITAAALISTTALVGVASTSMPANAQISVPNAAPFSFADLVEAVRPAVVSIRVKTKIVERRGPQFNEYFEMPDLPDDHPFQDFFRQFEDRFKDRGARKGRKSERPRFAQSMGSGFIISADGFVVTNNHVIEDAADVVVVLDNGEEMEASIIGTDPRTDLALLQINGVSDMPFVEFSDVEARVGDWVVAMGNPFGLGGTVTAGIVSARGRDINANAYDDFIQIDAAVNRGNSGGPAFDTTGKVVGVNTAIFSPNGGNVGIAFAIPASVVKQVVFDLMDDGNVTRGYLGVSIQDVTEDIASSVGLSTAGGAMVTAVRPDTPAQKAGLQSGDVVLSVNDVEIGDARDLSREIAQFAPGTEVNLSIWRAGEATSVTVNLGELSDEQALVEMVEEEQPDPMEPAETDTGLVLMPNDQGQGVLVVDVVPDTIASDKGFAAGEIILQANSNDVNSIEEFQAAIDDVLAAGRDTILLKVSRDGNTRFVGLPIE